MTLIITAFLMVVGLSIATILGLENEGRKAQFAKKSARRNFRERD